MWFQKTLHCVSFHGYFMSVRSSTSSVVVTFNSHIARYRENFLKFSFSFCTKNLIIFCQKIQISVSVPGNMISQTLHCVSFHVYCMTVRSSTSSVVVTTAWVVLSISKTLPYSLNLCLIWHGHVVVCCIFMEAWGYVCHSPIILFIPNPDFPVLYPILWSHSMDQPFAQWVYPFRHGLRWFGLCPGQSILPVGTHTDTLMSSCSKSFTQVLPHAKW